MRFIADENFDARIVKALRLQIPDFDIVLVQQFGLIETDDRIILEEAAQAGRVLLTHDVNTMPRYAFERIHAGQSMPGVIVVHDQTPLNRAIEDLAIVIGAGQPDDFENQVFFVPLQ
jgi:hypothetical protein